MNNNQLNLLTHCNELLFERPLARQDQHLHTLSFSSHLHQMINPVMKSVFTSHKLDAVALTTLYYKGKIVPFQGNLRF